jgi:MFS transporter, MHS family, shikimate and dehydroshikimate transport protein
MAVESAPSKLRALFSSGVQVGYSVGLILATGIVGLLEAVLGEAAFQGWGWRLPFLISAVFVGLALWIRAGVPESEVFEKEVEQRAPKARKLPVVEALRRHPAAFFQIIGMRLGELLTMYIVTTFALSYATSQHGFSSGFMLNIGLLVGAVGIVTIPLFAWLSDRYGRKPVFLIGAAVGALGTVPYFLSLESGSEILVIVSSVVLVNIAHDMIVSVQQPLFTELFGAEYRYSGAGLGYQVASAVGGGFTPFIATALVILGGRLPWRRLRRLRPRRPDPARPRGVAAAERFGGRTRDGPSLNGRCPEHVAG